MGLPYFAAGEIRLCFLYDLDCAAHVEHAGGDNCLLIQIEKLRSSQRITSRLFAGLDMSLHWRRGQSIAS